MNRIDRAEVRRRALYAAAHITFVAAATGCQSRQIGAADGDQRPQVGPGTGGYVAAAPANPGGDGAFAARTSCPPPVAATAAPPVATTTPSPVTTVAPPVMANADPTRACLDAAGNVPAGQPFPPAVALCCAGVIKAAEIAVKNHQPRPTNLWSCCDGNWDSPMCQAWGPPAPPRARRLDAHDRARIAARWGIGGRGAALEARA